MPRYRKFALVLGFFGLAVGVVNGSRYLATRGVFGTLAMTNVGPFWVVFALCIVWFVSRGGLVVRWSQVLVTAAVSYFFLYRVSAGTTGGEVMLIFAVFLAHKHDLLQTRARLKLGLLIGFAIAILFLNLVTGTLQPYSLLLRLAVLGTGMMIVWILFEDDIRWLMRRNRALVTQMQSERAFVEFGRNVVGIVHDLKGDISLPVMAAQMLSESVAPDGRKWLDYMNTGLNRAADRIDLVLYAAQATAAQATEEISVVRLVKSAIYVYQSSAELRRHVVMTFDYQQDYVFSGPRYLAMQIIENVIRNSVEALGAKEGAKIRFSLTDRTLAIANNGPPMPFGVGLPPGTDLVPLVRRGVTTTKADGHGIGLQTILSAAGRLDATIVMQNTANEVVTSVQFPVDAANVPA